MSGSGKARVGLWVDDESDEQYGQDRGNGKKHRVEGSVSPDLVIEDDGFPKYNPRDYTDKKKVDSGAGPAGPPRAARTDDWTEREDDDFEDETVDDDSGAGPAGAPAAPPVSNKDHWANRKAEMDALLVAQKAERAQVLAQISDLQEILQALDKQIDETQRGRDALEVLERGRAFDPVEGKDHLSRLPFELKYILKQYLTGLDLARLSRVDRSWYHDVHNPHDKQRIDNEKARWTKSFERIGTLVASGNYYDQMYNFLWYNDTPVFVNGRCQIKYTWNGNEITTQLRDGQIPRNDKFYGGRTHVYQWREGRGRYIFYAKWGDARYRAANIARKHHVEKCDNIVPFGGDVYFADNGIVRRFNPPDDPDNCLITDHDAVTTVRDKRISSIVKFAVSAEYIAIAKSGRIEVYDRKTKKEAHRFEIANKVQFLAMAGSTICVQFGRSITLHKVDGTVKRVFDLGKLRLFNPLGHTDGSFIFDLYDRPNSTAINDKYKLFRLAQYPAYDKFIDDDMQRIISKQYSEIGTFGVFIEQAIGANCLYVSLPG